MNAQFMRCARVCVAALSFISLFSLPPARAAELCGTMQEWLATPQAKAFRDRAKLTGVCPTNGLCDVPSTRDAAIANANTPLKIIPLRFHVIANDDGSDPAGTPGEIQAQVDNLNADFAGARIRFTYSMRTISNSTLRFVGAATGNVMRATLAENPEQQFNIFVTRYTNFNNCGIATYPWDSRALTSTGGMRLQDFSVAPGRFGRQSAFVECVTHEMGHMLGLLHTFAGTTEWTSSCQDCRELAGRNTFDGDRTGDYCSDTPPDSGFTSLVAPCTDGGTNRDTCATGSPFYTGLDTNNYMSYFLACYSQFTPQQVGRMHCWTANSLSSMLVTDSTPPVVAITSPADMIETNSLSPITGWTTDDIFVQSVGVTIREIVPGGGGRFWNGTNWQGTAFTLPTTLTGTNWALASGVALPPLNSGISYVVTASAVDGQFNAASTTATVQAPIEELTWDPGATHLGTAVKNSPHTLGGPFVYRIISLGTTVGGWRTALNVNSGEADVYLRRGVVPTAAVNDYRSDQIGSDGFVLHSSAFSPSEEWFYLVDAQAGAAWNLASGEPYVLDLGELPAAVLSGTTNVTIGAEGWRFFRTVAPADTLAWRLWLSGAPNRIYVKKDFIPFDFSYLHERSRAEALLVVPDYLQDNQTYFVGVPGARGQLLKFESKQQPISDLGFGAGHTVLSVSGYPYRTYRVPVPIDQIAWQVKTMPGVNNSDLAIRRGRVPNEDDNDAFSEVPGTVQDSVTLVPPTLSDGTFYITVYGQTNRSYALQNGEPVIPTRAFALTNVNDQPSLAGWRYYVVNDIPSQLGTLGWELILSNQPTNTEIALRRNAVPGRWNYRSQGGTFSQGYVDFTDGNGWLQRPGHQADIWYIGVYNGGANLGAFTLDTHAIVPAVAGFNNFSTNVSGLRPGKWGYFRIDVPANALGWDLRITDYAGGVPGFSVQRDTVPDSPATGVTLRDRAWPSTGYLPATDNWPAFYNYADGRHAYGQTLGVTRNNPLEPGTYYVAIRDDSGPGPLTFTFQSRGIGTNFAIGVSNLNFSGPGSTVTGTLAAGEPAFYRLVIPPNQPSWKLRLTPNTGDALMLVQRDFLPNVGAGGGNYRSDGNRVIKQGREYFLVLPQTGVLSGETNYIAVISEGEGSDRSTSRLGTGSINYTLESLGPVAVANLGSLTATPGSSVGQHVSLEGGDVKLFRFTVAPNTPVLEVRLSNRIGHPSVAVAPGTNVPNPHVPLPFSVSGADAYGAEGGTTADRRESYTLITMMNPAPGTYSLTVKAEDSGGVYPDAEADLSVTVRGPTTVAFNAGTSSVVSQPANEWRFFQITVPAGALGWDVRLKDVTGGNPYLFVRRDLVPDPALGSLYVHGDDWPSGEQLRAPYADWTDRYLNADFESSAYQRLVVGRDNPLVPGTYLVGVFNEPGYLIGDVSYTLESRGIGSGFALGITNLNFAGAGSAYTNDVGLAPREAEYFRIVIPPNQRNWKLRLTPTSSGGELMMLVRFNEVPNTAQTAAPWNQVGKRISKLGKEHYMLLPDDGQDFISPGTNYIVVVGEGHFPNDSQTIGAGDVPYILESLGEQSTTDLGLVPNVGAGIISHHVSMEGGEVELFRFALSNNVESLEIRLENVTGFPYFSMVPGTHAPYPDDYPLTVSDDRYGSDGGWITGLIGTHSLLNIANPTPGVYSVAIKAENRSTFEDVECDITITPIGSGNLAFDGGTTSVNGHAEGTWRYFTIEVPADALGWDLRLSGVTGQSVTLYARRDELPEQFAPGVTPGHWQSGEQWAASSEWTGLANPDGTSAYGHIIQVGRGNPLTNGTYRIGVYNGSSGPASYTLTSRGIGASYSIPVTSVGYVSDTPHFGLAPRELAYYAVEVPSNAPSWKLKLDTSAGGEARMIVQKDVLPHIHAGFASVLYGGKTLAKDGDEHYVLLPVDGETNVPGGTYYIAVLSEGVGPSGGRLGSDPSAFTLRSQGALPVAAIGTVPAAGLTLMHSMSESVPLRCAPECAVDGVPPGQSPGQPGLRNSSRRGIAVSECPRDLQLLRR
jgi:large repetitive protein